MDDGMQWRTSLILRQMWYDRENVNSKVMGKHISSLKVSNAEEPGALNICLRPHKDNTWVEIFS